MDNGVLSQLLAPALQKAAVEHGQADLASNAISALDDMEQQVSLIHNLEWNAVLIQQTGKCRV